MPKTNEDKLAAVRFIMETFDWDRGDRQLVLELLRAIGAEPRTRQANANA